MIEIIFIGIISGIVSASVVIAYSKHLQRQRMNKMVDYAQNILEAFEERVVKARLEFEDNVIRMYNRETDEFLAQGKSWDELNDTLKQRFPDKLFDVNQEQINRASQYSK